MIAGTLSAPGHRFFDYRTGMASLIEPRPFSGLPHSAGELLRTP